MTWGAIRTIAAVCIGAQKHQLKQYEKAPTSIVELRSMQCAPHNRVSAYDKEMNRPFYSKPRKSLSTFLVVEPPKSRRSLMRQNSALGMEDPILKSREKGP